MTNKLNSSCNAVFLLMYHLIIVVKYRRKIFDNKELVDDLKAKIIELSNRFDVEIIEQEVDKDNIHILFKAKPVLDMKKYINVYSKHRRSLSFAVFFNQKEVLT